MENEIKTSANIITVPYIVHEGEMERMERHCKRLWIAVIIALSLLAITNLAWLWYESTFVTVSYTQDGEGLNNINTGSQGDVYGSDSEGEAEEVEQVCQSAGAQGD